MRRLPNETADKRAGASAPKFQSFGQTDAYPSIRPKAARLALKKKKQADFRPSADLDFAGFDPPQGFESLRSGKTAFLHLRF